ncbi:MAG TPA: hypothetical protein PKY59_08930 [Pyrinomonadaceae bacterium]|nr:hypothetical protein [Pyrinomonadaceae bacterium]
MRKRSLPQNTTQKIKRERDPIPWRYCLMTLFCGFLLVGGFFLAARQHFSSIDYSIKNSQLKKQLDELESEKRRLILNKEIALTPDEIKKAAKKLGFTEVSTAISAVVDSRSTTSEIPKTEKPLIRKTVDSAPVQSFLSKTTESKDAKKSETKNDKKGKQSD